MWKLWKKIHAARKNRNRLRVCWEGIGIGLSTGKKKLSTGEDACRGQIPCGICG